MECREFYIEFPDGEYVRFIGTVGEPSEIPAGEETIFDTPVTVSEVTERGNIYDREGSD